MRIVKKAERGRNESLIIDQLEVVSKEGTRTKLGKGGKVTTGEGWIVSSDVPPAWRCCSRSVSITTILANGMMQDSRE